MRTTVGDRVRWALAVLAHLAAVMLIGVVDRALRSEILLAPFYVIPIITSSYRLGRGAGIIVAVAASVAWSLTAESGANVSTSALAAAWNSLSRAAIYVTLAVVVDLFAREHRRVRRSAATDELTTLLNARGLHDRLREELARAHRHIHPLALLYVDSDQLKQINDRWGHESGDRVLVALAERLRRDRRTADVVARIGGDEFVLVLPETGETAAGHAAERLRSVVAGEPFTATSGELVRLTVSVGVASTDGAIDAAEMLRRADAALYRAKLDGRDRVAHWTQELVARPSHPAGS